jgi:hypothetical protein
MTTIVANSLPDSRGFSKVSIRTFFSRTTKNNYRAAFAVSPMVRNPHWYYRNQASRRNLRQRPLKFARSENRIIWRYKRGAKGAQIGGRTDSSGAFARRGGRKQHGGCQTQNTSHSASAGRSTGSFSSSSFVSASVPFRGKPRRVAIILLDAGLEPSGTGDRQCDVKNHNDRLAADKDIRRGFI